jgi:hypothetical protein
MNRLLTFITIAIGVIVTQGSAQDIVTGPPVGTALTPVMAYGAGGPQSGPFDGRELDVAAEIGEGPGALLFVHEITRNILPVVRGLDITANRYAIKSFKSFTLLLHADRSAAESRLKAVNGSLKLRNPMLLSLNGAEGPGNYALNRKATLSLILVNHGKVVRSVALTDVNQEDAGKLSEWVEELTGPIPSNPAELRGLVEARLPKDTESLRKLALDQGVEIQELYAQLQRVQNRTGGMQPNQMAQERRDTPRARAARPGAPGRRVESPETTQEPSTNAGTPPPVQVRQGKPPEDPELNSLLRSFIRKTHDAAQVDAIFADIEKRAGLNDDLKTEAVEMFKLMLSFRDRYGSDHAQELAEGFLKAHGTSR